MLNLKSKEEINKKYAKSIARESDQNKEIGDYG